MIFHTQSLILALKVKLCMIIHTQTSVYPTIQRVITESGLCIVPIYS